MPNDYQEYGYSTSGPGTRQKQILARIFVLIARDLKDVESICDLGCGNGYLASQLGALGHQVTGIDGSKSGIEIASTYYGTDKVGFICSEITPDLVSSFVKTGRFDVVVSSDVIEHMYRPSDLIETAALLLKPGGHLIVGAPYHGYLKNFALSVFNRWDFHHTVDWDGGHIKFFSVKSLRNLVRRHGFENPQFHFAGRIPLLWKNMICVARNPR